MIFILLPSALISSPVCQIKADHYGATTVFNSEHLQGDCAVFILHHTTC